MVNIPFSLADYLFSALCVSAVFYLYYYIRYMAGVQRRVRHYTHKRFRWKPKPADEQTDGSEPATHSGEARPGVSVIVCARNEAYNLQNYLQALCSQKYPLFEVIVVNDGSEDNTQTVLEHSTQLFRNLRLTFVPGNALVRSSKKLALTLAAKAAKYDYLLLTDADCRPESPLWIEQMMQGFRNPQTEVVLGYGGDFEEHGLLNRLIQFDTVTSAMTYLGFALSGHPYMGVGRNLAYKKETFFRNNGFAGLLAHQAGDDDLFVNKVATRSNTEVVITPDSFTWSVPKHSYHDWRIQKTRHLSVSPDYKLSSKIRPAAEPVMRGLLYLLCIAISVLAAQGMVPITLCYYAWGLFLARLIWLIALTGRAAHIFGVHSFGLVTLLFDIFLPLFHLFTLAKHAVRGKKEYQW